MSSESGQQHPLGVYFKVWFLLFVLSGFSYLVDILQLQGYLRWTLILVFMALKAGLIIAIFMHMAWERLAFAYAIILPPVLLITFIGIGALEGNYISTTRNTFFSEPSGPTSTHSSPVGSSAAPKH